MRRVGIEALNVCAGTAYIDVESLGGYRGADPARVKFLLMREKTVLMPYEDPVTFAVNAAAPLVEKLPPEIKDQINLVITCTESGLDFGKSISTYVHRELGLPHACRLVELKQACYSGVAGLQLAAAHILANVTPGSKALVIATDVARMSPLAGPQGDWVMAELVAGSGAIAMIVGDDPKVFEIDIGASGCYGFEVMDTCRPFSDGGGIADAELSLMSYLDCLDAAYANYVDQVEDVDFRESFHFLAFHAPFGGMVQGAHKRLMRNQCRAAPDEIKADFSERLEPGLEYVARVGNILGGSLLLALVSTIENAAIQSPRRVGCFAYGSGCCSEFFSGVVPETARATVATQEIRRTIDNRYCLKPEEYCATLEPCNILPFGIQTAVARTDLAPEAAEPGTHKHLYLKEIHDYHRHYEWR